MRLADSLWTEWKIALRFLLDNRMQTLLITFGIAVGSAVIVFITALITGLQANVIQRTLGTQAHIRILPPDEVNRTLPAAADSWSLVLESPRAQRLRSIINWQDVRDVLDQDVQILAVSPVISGPAIARRGVAHDAQMLDRVAMLEAGEMLLAVAPDAQLQPVGQGVHDRYAHAVQTARHLVGVLVELTAGVQLGHDDLGGRHAFLGVDVGGNAASVVGDRDRSIGVQDDLDQVGVAGQRLVDGVVDHLIDHVVQARAVVGVADIHAGALAHGVQAFENLDGIGAVFRQVGNRIGHEIVGSEVPTGTGMERRCGRSNRRRSRTAPKPATYRKFGGKSEDFRAES